jgi:hypothetical protein
MSLLLAFKVSFANDDCNSVRQSQLRDAERVQKERNNKFAISNEQEQARHAATSRYEDKEHGDLLGVIEECKDRKGIKLSINTTTHWLL